MTSNAVMATVNTGIMYKLSLLIVQYVIHRVATTEVVGLCWLNTAGRSIIILELGLINR